MAEITHSPRLSTALVLADVQAERVRQDAKWGEQNHPDGTAVRSSEFFAQSARLDCQHAAEHGKVTWRLILLEEVYEALAEKDPTKLRDELAQVAAVAVAWIEDIDRRTGHGAEREQAAIEAARALRES